MPRFTGKLTGALPAKNQLMPLLAALLLTLVAGMLGGSKIAGLEARLGDYVWRLISSPAQQEKRLVIIDIDEASLAEYGPWPWRRDLLADLVEKAAGHGIELNIFDIVFPAEKPGDERLAAALAATPSVLAQVLAVDAGVPMRAGQLSGGVNGIDCGARFKRADFVLASNGRLSAAAASAGHITPHVDDDGVVRKVPAFVCVDNKAYPVLSLAAFLAGTGQQGGYSVDPGKGWLSADLQVSHPGYAGLQLPVDAGGMIRVPWHISRDRFTAISAADLLNDRLPPGGIRAQWALFGSTALSAGDVISTPFNGTAAGFEVHAQLLAGLLDGNVPYQPAAAGVIQLAWILLLAGLLYLTASARGLVGVYAPTAVALSLSLLTFSLHGVLLARASLWVPWLLPVFFLMTAGLLQALRGYAVARVDSERLYRNLSSYLPEHAARWIARHEPVGSTQAHHENVVVMYADLRNFSAWCDQLEAEQAGAILHTYYTLASTIIREAGGDVEEYVGDAVLAIWRDCDNPDRIMSAANRLVTETERLFGDRARDESLPPLALGIGIEYGQVLIGAFGPARRRAYTALGRAVSHAISLQSMTVDLAMPVLIGENAARLWKGQYEMKSQGLFLLAGARQSSEIFVPHFVFIEPPLTGKQVDFAA